MNMSILGCLQNQLKNSKQSMSILQLEHNIMYNEFFFREMIDGCSTVKHVMRCQWAFLTWQIDKFYIQ